MKVTPILFVDQIEPCLPLWMERLGFEKTVEVPAADQLAFVILQKGTAEIMLQSKASLEQDLKPPAGVGSGSSTLFIEVPDFADLRNRIAGSEVVVPERVTFYGMREIGIREPGGHLLVFAAKEP